MEYVGESPIPVATVHRDAGRQLVALAKAGRSLTVDQDPYTDYVYDLTRDYPGPGPGPARWSTRRAGASSPGSTPATTA